jgi:predicted enzyme related to lactoylglutathione lyase
MPEEQRGELSSRREVLETGARAILGRRPRTEAESTVDVLGVDSLIVSVGDLDEARLFYGRLLGLTVKFDLPESGVVAYRLGPEPPFLVIREDVAVAPSRPRETPRLCFEVPDVRQASAALERAGIVLLAPPQEVPTGWHTEFTDAWGNVLGLIDYTKQPGRGRMFRRLSSPDRDDSEAPPTSP